MLKDTDKNVWNSTEEKHDFRDLNFLCFPSLWATEVEVLSTAAMKTTPECLPPCLRHLSRLSHRNGSIFSLSTPCILTDSCLHTFINLSFLWTSLYRQIKTLTLQMWCCYQPLYCIFKNIYLALVPILQPSALSSPLKTWSENASFLCLQGELLTSPCIFKTPCIGLTEVSFQPSQ